jgi:starch-binding outer membrane protein SusE/F
MKKSIQSSILIALAVVSFCSCEKDEIKTIAYTGRPGSLTASPTTLVLTSTNANDTVETFSWVPTDYGYQAAVKYTLQIAKGGTNFTAPKEINMGSATQQKFSGADFNQMAIILGLPPGSPGQLDVRVKSSISDSIKAVYSNNTTLTVTPYLVVINYPSLWVPGDYQGWDPVVAPKISSKAANGIYEGYVNIPGGSLKFKFTSHPDWNHTNYGWASSTVTGSNVTGTFNTTGGDLFVPTTGYFLLKANTNSNTWSGTKTTWGLIGDAVPTTGWTDDRDLTYNTAAKTWSITLNLNAGNVKFRANDDWPINFGDNGADLSLEYDGSNIAIGAAGNYTITLDLSVPGNYTYKVVKN